MSASVNYSAAFTVMGHGVSPEGFWVTITLDRDYDRLVGCVLLLDGKELARVIGVEGPMQAGRVIRIWIDPVGEGEPS